MSIKKRKKGLGFIVVGIFVAADTVLDIVVGSSAGNLGMDC